MDLSVFSDLFILTLLKAPRNFIVMAHAQKRGAERNISKSNFVAKVLIPDRKPNQRRGEQGGTVCLFTKKMGAKKLHFAELSMATAIFLLAIGHESSKHHQR